MGRAGRVHKICVLKSWNIRLIRKCNFVGKRSKTMYINFFEIRFDHLVRFTWLTSQTGNQLIQIKTAGLVLKTMVK